MNWVLIFYFVGAESMTSHSADFATKKNCETAKIKLLKEAWGYKTKAWCFRK